MIVAGVIAVLCGLGVVLTGTATVIVDKAKYRAAKAPGAPLTADREARMRTAQQRIRDCFDGWDCTHMDADVSHVLAATGDAAIVVYTCSDEARDANDGKAKEWAEGYCDGEWQTHAQKDGLWGRALVAP